MTELKNTTKTPMTADPLLAPVKFTSGDIKYFNIITGKAKCYDVKLNEASVSWCMNYINVANEYIQSEKESKYLINDKELDKHFNDVKIYFTNLITHKASLSTR